MRQDFLRRIGAEPGNLGYHEDPAGLEQGSPRFDPVAEAHVIDSTLGPDEVEGFFRKLQRVHRCGAGLDPVGTARRTGSPHQDFQKFGKQIDGGDGGIGKLVGEDQRGRSRAAANVGNVERCVRIESC